MKKLLSVILFAALFLVILLAGCGKTPQELYQEQYNLGIRYLSEGNYEEAIIAFEAAIEIDPRSVDAYIYLADTYVQSGDAMNAVSFLDETLTAIENKELIFETDDGEIDQEFTDDLYNDLSGEKESIYSDLTQEEKDILNIKGIYGTAQEELESSWTPLPLDSLEVVVAEEYIYRLNSSLWLSGNIPNFESIEEIDYECLLDIYMGHGLANNISIPNGSISEVDLVEKAIQDNFNPYFEFGEEYQFSSIGPSNDGSYYFYTWNEEYQGYVLPGIGYEWPHPYRIEVVQAYKENDKVIIDAIEYILRNVYAEQEMVISGQTYMYNEIVGANVFNDEKLVGTAEYIMNENDYPIDEIVSYTVHPDEHVQVRYVLFPKEDEGYYMESKTYK